MSELNLTHSNGNKVKLTTPDTLAASRTFKLPGTDGSAGQVLQTDGNGNLSWYTIPTDTNGLVKLATLEVAEGSASTTAFHFNNVFSSTYSDYMAYFDIRKTAVAPMVFCCQFGKTSNGSVITSNFYARGTSNYQQVGTSNMGQSIFVSSDGIFQLNGTIDGSTSGFGFKGFAHIIDPFNNSTSNGVCVNTEIMMQYHTTNANKWREEGGCMGDHGEQQNLKDIRFGVVSGNASAGNVTSSAAFAPVYGRCTIYGVQK
tara:strand:+ start:635 stop:1408 length:774 start_codon:yes stop_codon:yes gene_type:complete